VKAVLEVKTNPSEQGYGQQNKSIDRNY